MTGVSRNGNLEYEISHEFVEQDHNLVQTDWIQDKAIIGKMTKRVRVRDPIDRRLLVSLRNPEVPIKTYQDPENSKIDLNKSIIKGENNPTINLQPHLRYIDEFKGWQAMAQLVDDKRRQKQLWD